MRRFILPGVLAAMAALALAGCPAPGSPSDSQGGGTPQSSPVAATGVTLNKSTTTMLVGGTEQLTATVAPAGATNKGLTWSSDDSTKASVSASGLLTAAAAGSATITATTTDGSFTATCTVAVSAVVVPATGVTLNTSSATITVGGTEQLTPIFAPANATNQNVTWSSSDTSKATVSGGLVTAVAVGSATITVTTVDGSHTATCNVTVDPIHVSGVSLDKSSTTITVGGTEQLTATIAPANATNKSVTWSSSDESKATVSGGLVTAVAAGPATITVTTVDGSHTATCSVTVSAVPTHTITFQGNGGSGTMSAQVIPEGFTANLTANGFTRSLYVFSGWSTTSNGSVAYNDKQAYVMGSTDVTLYAIWTVSSSLLIHYNFDSQDGTDSSGNGNNGTPHNIAYVSDGNGGYSASFNGSSSYIALPNSTILNQSSFTMMMRFKASPAQTGVLFGYQNQSVGTPTPSQFMPVIVVRSDGLLYGELWIGSDLVVHSVATVNDDQWHTVYFSTNGSSISLYLDGVSLGTASGAVQSLSMIYNQIGASDCDQRAYMPNANGINGWRYFDGLIDDFYFYNTALN